MFFGLNLLPKEDKFFELLTNSSELSHDCVHLLNNLTREANFSKQIAIAQEISTIKNKIKEVSAEITERLCRTLLTPFDHEDIHRLSRILYKIPKICDKAQERILTFQLQAFQGDLIQLTDNMVNASNTVKELIKSLKKITASKPIYEKCALIHNIESNNDKLLNQLTINLYKNENDFKALLLRKELYGLIEDVVDRHRDIANVILEITLKHS